MRLITVGKIVSKYDVRIYIYSNLSNVRPIFQELFANLSKSVLPDAECTLIILSNQNNQYHTIGNLNESNLWRGLKKIKNQYQPILSYIQLVEDLTINRDCQIFVVNSDKKSFITDRTKYISEIVTTGVTIITFHENEQQKLKFDTTQ